MSENTPKTFSRGDIIAKKYEIEKLLGEGMVGSTYLARHIPTKRQVVIRFIHPNLVADQRDRERLRQVFDRSRAVRHDLLVRYGELGVHEGRIYNTEEYFPSQSLREVIDASVSEGRPFSLQEACQIVISVLDAAEAAHEAGIFHRNLKPENVLVHSRQTGPAANAKIIRTIKVTGLGLSAILNPTIFAESFVSRDEAPYLAPELSGFDQEGAPQVDVYSAGVMLYELLCGQRPMGTYLAPTRLRDDLPEHLDTIVDNALAYSPEDRYPTPRDMVNDIQRSFTLEMQQRQSTTSFRSAMMGLGIAAVLAVGAGAWLLTTEKPDPNIEARQRDEAIRKRVQADNPLPSEIELKAMAERHRDMVYVPGGKFLSGRLESEASTVATSSEPLREVVNVDAFYIDRFEFPNRPGEKPAVRVTWDKAAEACAAVGKRLCTEKEWEKACKGPGNLIYSYGDDYSADVCGADLSRPYTLGTYKDCVSGYGAYEMSGGIREWTSSAPGGKPGRRLVKGGLRGNDVRGTRCAFSVDESRGYAETTLGLRCCLNADGTTGADGEEGDSEATEGQE